MWPWPKKVQEAESRNVDTIQFLHASGANINVSGDEGDTITHGTKILSLRCCSLGAPGQASAKVKKPCKGHVWPSKASYGYTVHGWGLQGAFKAYLHYLHLKL